MVNAPAPSVTATAGGRSASTERASAVTPGSTSPVASVTVPVMAASWAATADGAASPTRRTSRTRTIPGSRVAASRVVNIPTASIFRLRRTPATPPARRGRQRAPQRSLPGRRARTCLPCCASHGPSGAGGAPAQSSDRRRRTTRNRKRSSGLGVGAGLIFRA